MHIRIVGLDDESSRKLTRRTREVAAELHLKADVEFGPIDTLPGGLDMPAPALVVDGHVKAAGRVPTRNEIGSWLHPRPR